MGTYTVVTISGPAEDLAKVKIEKLPEFEWEGYGWDERTMPDGEVFLYTEGNTKWEPEGVREWAQKFTAKPKRATLTVQVTEEWDTRDADEAGIRDDVYRHGRRVVEESHVNGLIPDGLLGMLRAGRTAIAGWDKALEGDSGDAEIDAAIQMKDALEALIDGLATNVSREQLEADA